MIPHINENERIIPDAERSGSRVRIHVAPNNYLINSEIQKNILFGEDSEKNECMYKDVKKTN